MPLLATHLHHAMRLHELRPELEWSAFARGTIFPDIRKAANIDRSRTHWPHTITIQKVLQESDAWRAGVLFHNWTDDAWNTFFGADRSDPENETEDEMLHWAALKLLEDQIVRTEAPLLVTAEMFAVAEPKAVEFGVDPDLARRWGEIVGGLLERNVYTSSDVWGTTMAMSESFQQAVSTRLEELTSEGIWEQRAVDCQMTLNRKIAEAVRSYGA